MKINPFIILIIGGILIFTLPFIMNHTPTTDICNPNMGMTRICP